MTYLHLPRVHRIDLNLRTISTATLSPRQPLIEAKPEQEAPEAAAKARREGGEEAAADEGRE